MGVLGFLIAKCCVLEGEVLVERISRKAEELARQCALAAEGIAAERVWPGSPDAATLKGCAEDIAAQRSVVVALEEQLHDARQALKAIVGKARKEMGRVDCASDILYGMDGAQKAKFGLTPKKKSREPLGEPGPVVIDAIADGTQPGSIWLDWSPIVGAVYEVRWFSDAELTRRAGGTTVTASKMEIEDLEPGTQYWFRVRAVRGGKTGPWSEPVTRFANV
jgi:hypothetical protein